MSTLIGPLGAMVEVRSPRGPLPVTHTRPTSTVTLLSGLTVAQRAPEAGRSWEWRITAGSPADVAGLIALEQGVYGPPPWRWYDKMAAALNMLPPMVAAAGLGPEPWRHLADDASALAVTGPLVADGARFAASIGPARILTVPVRDGAPDPVPVIEGRPYTAAYWLADASGRIALVWVDADGIEVGRDMSPFGTGRRTVTGTAPAGAAGVLVEIAVGDLTHAAQMRGGHAMTPHDAALTVTGDIDLRVRAGLDRWVTGIQQVVMAKYVGAGDQRGYELVVRQDGRLALSWTADGTNATFHRAESTVPLPVSDGQVTWLRGVLDVDNGASGWTARLYYSTDATPTWVQLGDDITGTGTTAIHPSTAPLYVGTNAVGDAPASGVYHAAQVRNGIGGTLVAAADWTPTGPWVIGDDSSTPARTDSTGRAWALQGDAAIAAEIVPDPDARLTALQLTETPTEIGWHPGMGIPRVVLTRVDEAYRMVSPSMRDQTLTMTEVA
ncbi:hypothetical protein [Stackebrandtia soli]|uniref:hypothetical protein n=1 Tax=Stackebrandtia soli TaxID=1892856 RepID=UPI0039ECC09E